MKKDNNDLKIYILVFCAIVLFSILITIKNIPFSILGINQNTSPNYIGIYNAIYYIMSCAISIIFILVKRKKSIDDIFIMLKKYATGLGAILVYFLLSELELLPFQLLNIDYTKIPIYLKVIYILCYEAILVGIIVLIHLKKLKTDFNDLKKNHDKYFKDYLKYWLIAVFVMYISNFIISLIGPQLPNNEEIIRQQFQISPIYIFVSAVIFAPLLEELIFRQSFRNLFENKWLFIITSGIVFGSLHVINSNPNLIDLLYIIPYSAPGIAFAYMLYKTDNIFVSVGFHLLHNGILISLQFLFLYFM